MSQNFLGPGPQQQEFNALQASSSAQQDGLAIVSNGDTHAAIASGQFVYVKNHSSLAEGLYKATEAISTNAKLSTSNLIADSAGGLNALKDDVDALNSSIDLPITLLSDLTAFGGFANYSVKMGRIVLISIMLNNTSGGEWPQGGNSAPLTDVGAVPRPVYNSGAEPGDTSSIIDIVNRTGGRVRVRKDGTLLGQNIATGAQTFTGMYISE